MLFRGKILITSFHKATGELPRGRLPEALFDHEDPIVGVDHKAPDANHGVSVAGNVAGLVFGEPAAHGHSLRLCMVEPKFILWSKNCTVKPSLQFDALVHVSNIFCFLK